MSPTYDPHPPRNWRSFPTRQAAGRLANQRYTLLKTDAATQLPRGVCAQIVGIDASPRPMPDTQVLSELGDPLAQLVLGRGNLPMTARALLTALDVHNNDTAGLPQEDVFVAADGGNIPWTPERDEIGRQYRFVIVRRRSGEPLLMVSTGPDLDSDDVFLQVLAWDSSRRQFNFYMRVKPGWLWAGNSWHAFDPRCRGQGCFDSHVNGTAVMKERRLPWIHWHSAAASLDAGLSPSDPLRTEPRFIKKAGADILQTQIMEPWVQKWTEARVDRSLAEKPGFFTRTQDLMRNVFSATTVNLVTSTVQSSLVDDDTDIDLPPGFFFNQDALFGSAGLDPTQLLVPKIKGNLYKQAARAVDLHVEDGGVRVADGDVFFAFCVPEAAFEDSQVLQELASREILSRRFAAATAMTDFPNPIESRDREALLKHVPEECQIVNGVPSLEEDIVRSIRTLVAKQPASIPEVQFLKVYDDPNWQSESLQTLAEYLVSVKTVIESPQGIVDIFRLAESRRRQFRKRKLFEFDLTVPRTSLPADMPALKMLPTGAVVEA